MAYTEAAAPDNADAQRAGDGTMDDEKCQSIVHSLLSASKQFVDTELSPARAKATEYYKGEPFGNEEEGRSQVVLTELRDLVHSVMPALMRVFLGPDRTVEFVPRRADAVDAAEQATDYVQHVVLEQNPGFRDMVSVLKDGFIRKMGIYKWAWEKSSETKTQQFDNISESELEEILMSDDGIEVELVKSVSVPAPKLPQPLVQPGAPQAQPMQEKYFNATVRYTETIGAPKVWAIPPEEFWFDRNAKSIEDALVVAHASDCTRGELIALGVSEEDLDEYGSTDLTLRGSAENVARHNNASFDNADPEAGKANQRILYVEAYPKIDYDGDGIAELRKICTIGPGFHIVKNDPFEERPFSYFCPHPEPHTLLGLALSDMSMDMQLTKSLVFRSTLDSLSLSLFPRYAFEEGYVSIEDLLNTEIGSTIRTTKPGAVQPLTVPFVGEGGVGIMSLIDDIMERRTGKERGAAGLDADSLQSTTKDGVGAVLTASQAQDELLARVFAEMALKPMFKGVLRLLVKHRPKAQVIRLRGKWVEVDPRVWDASMDVKVNVALGLSYLPQKIATLVGIAAKQQEILATYGPTNPICTVAQYRNTLALIAELQGYPDAARFFSEVAPDWQPPPPAPPPPTPEHEIAMAQLESEKIKAQKAFIIQQERLAHDERKEMRDHEFRLLELETNAELKRFQIEAQFHTTRTAEEIRTEVAHDVAAAGLELDIAKMTHDHTMDEKAHDLAQTTQADNAAAAQAAPPAPGGTE